MSTINEENGYLSFEKAFKECCARCNYRMAYDKRRQSAEVAAAEQERDALYAVIAEKLGDDQRLINLYDAAVINTLSMDTEYIYQQGFQDCITLLRWLNLL